MHIECRTDNIILKEKQAVVLCAPTVTLMIIIIIVIVIFIINIIIIIMFNVAAKNISYCKVHGKYQKKGKKR